MTPPSAWTAMLRQAGRWADRFDEQRLARLDPRAPGHRQRRTPMGPGAPATAWALARSAVTAAGAPILLPAMALAARRTSEAARGRIDKVPDHLHALAEGRCPPLAGDRTLRLPATERYVITSDLHRCVPGRLDWPRLQGVKDLYATVLEGYGADGWHLIENGDVEDFWMVGGSTWGVVYDVAGMAELAAKTVCPGAPSAALPEHLDRIVANNARTYEVLRDAFGAQGRYHRTMGNHDNAYTLPSVVDRLREHLPGVEVADTILLTGEGTTPADGIAGVDAVVAHGHLTDSWNGPGFAALGRAVTGLGTTLGDLPPGLRRRLEDPPAHDVLERLLDRGWNQLITVDERFGGNRRLDTLDEQRLFATLAASEPPGGWPWIIHGHTHYPMVLPHDVAGRAVRYANSGCGVLDRAFTALEWDASDPERPLTLVVWTDRDRSGPERIELVPDGARVRAAMP